MRERITASGMVHAPLIGMLGVWGELVEAYHGCNGYGTDTAEIYAYRLTRYLPSAVSTARGGGVVIEDRLFREASAHAGYALLELLELFTEQYGCDAEIDGQLFGTWFLREPFVHRCHVRITHTALTRTALPTERHDGGRG